MTRTQSDTLLVLPAVLLLLSGCSHLGIGRPDGEEVIDVGSPGPALTCQTTGPVPADTQVVGPGGGQLTVGNNLLVIPANAVQDNIQMIFTRLPGDSIRLQVEPKVRFVNNKSASLIIDVSGCDSDTLRSRSWSIWRIHPSTRSQSQKLRTRFEDDLTLRRGARATTRIDSTSVYMIAN